jgi:GNAT superfamily N-acetyltransferase
MEFDIISAESWGEFEEHWIGSLEYLPWFKNPNPADYQAEIERKKLHEEFNHDNHVYLLGKPNKDETFGVLEFTIEESQARNGVMMPAAPQIYHNSGVGSALLHYQEQILVERGVKRVSSVLKYRSRQNVQWYYKVLEEKDFRKNGPECVQMMLCLDRLNPAYNKTRDLEFKIRTDFKMDDFVEFCLLSYNSTLDDRAIHDWDLTVTNPKHVRDTHRMIVDGVYGDSPPEWWKVAVMDEKPVGYIIGFCPANIGKPDLGIIGNLGVFPRYRRRGISVALVNALLMELKESGKSWAMVGTSVNNVPAIQVYSKIGFSEANRVQFFVKKLRWNS